MSQKRDRHADPFASIDIDQLENVTGGVTTTSGTTSSDQLTQLMTELTSELSTLTSNANSGSSQMMQMMEMMMMMNGGMGAMGGYSAGASSGYVAPTTTVIAPTRGTKIVGG